MASRASLDRARRRKQKALADKRVNYPNRVIALWKDVMRERIEQNRALVSHRVCRGDCHIHSTFSDGTGTVPEVVEWAHRAGLDFAFITDHGTVRQKGPCAKFPGIWWGQEPGTQYHHLGILGLDRKYTPKKDLPVDYRNIIDLGGFPFIPHPAGWFPSTHYGQDKIDALDLLGDDFSIEIINGANNIFDCYDITDEWSIGLWDKHLCQGKTVRAMGNTDAHLPHAVGDVWNGVLVPRLTKAGVLKAFWAGRFFVSDAPFINLKSGKAEMGGTVAAAKRSSVDIQFACADSLGLQQVRVIANGKVVKVIWPRHEKVVEGTYRLRFSGGSAYVRAECFARDNRRAYTNPIYIREP